MIPRRLTLRGVTRFTGEIAVDFDRLPDGLIAVAGPNGSGKTTILESMGPGALFLELPSRPGNLRDRVNRRDAFLELIEDFGGRTWRHLVQVDPGTGASGAKVEPYLWTLADGAELPPVGAPVPDGTWVDPDGYPTTGRVNDYAAALEGLGFPSRDVFLAGPFSVHTGAGNFLELDAAGRRALFVTLLGLEGLEALAARAGAARKPLDAALGELQELAAALERDRQAAAGLEASVAQLGAELERHAATLAELEARQAGEVQELAAHRAELGTLEDARRQATARRLELQASVARLEAEIARLETAIGADQVLEAAETEIRAAAARHQELTTRRATLLGDRQAKITAKASAAREVERAATDARRFRGDLAGHRRRLEDLDLVAGELETRRQERAALGEGHQGLQAARQALQELEAELTRAQAAAPNVEATRARLERLERDAELLAGVPCKGGRVVGFTPPILTGEDPAVVGALTAQEPGQGRKAGEADCGSCRFLVDARQAAGELPEARQVLERAEEAVVVVARLVARRGELGGQVAELEAKARQVERLEDAIGHLVRRLEGRAELERQVADTAARAVELEAKAPELLELERQAQAAVDQVDADGRAIRVELDQLEAAPRRLEDLVAALARLPAARARLVEARQALERDRATLEAVVVPPEPVQARQRVQVLEARGRATADQVTGARAAQDRAREALGHARGRLAELGDLVARATALEAATARLARRRAGFRELERAVGRTGLQVLEIDAAGPTVAALTNDLLAATFGGRFSVRLDTVTEGGQGRKVRETFDLVVLDGNRKARAEDSAGGKRAEARERLAADVSELSKGERVLVDEALKLAIAMFHAHRGGAKILTLWRDECDTGLDPENRARYPGMLRRALEIGGFRRLYFVSHDPTVQAQADAVIRVSAGGAVTFEAGT